MGAGKLSPNDVKRLRSAFKPLPKKTDEFDEDALVTDGLRNSVIVHELKHVVYAGDEFRPELFKELLRELGIFSHA